MQELKFEQVEDVNGGGGVVGGVVGGAVGAVAGFFAGSAQVAFNSDMGVSEGMTTIGKKVAGGAISGAVIGSGAGLVTGVATTAGSLFVL
jgi:lactobin A/cerein 7B family class IIb bacteriocin